jgi:integrase/recombinase XerD
MRGDRADQADPAGVAPAGSPGGPAAFCLLPSAFGEDKKGPLFRAALAKNGALSERAMIRRRALDMIYRRAKAAGIATQIGCHTFRATGITIYLTNGGTLEKAQMMAAHSSPRTTKLYDRTSDAVSLDEVEKVVF